MTGVKRKILFLVTQSEFGGAQRYVYEISKALSEKHDILVAAGHGDGELFKKLESTEALPLYLKHLKRAPNPLRIIQAIAEIVHVLKKEKPDILFLCSTTAGLLGSIASKIYKLKTRNYQLKTIYRVGGWAFNDPRPFWQNWLIFWMEKITARFKDLIIVNSEYDWRIAVEKKIISPEKIVKIYNGIDVGSLDFLSKEEARNLLTSDFNRLLKSEVNEVNKLWIGCVANFYKTKGLEYLIMAMTKSVGIRYQQTKLVIIGEGRERPKLEAMIKKYDLKNKVILAGRILDAYKYLKAFDVFVLPSLKEGFPWVILEAIAARIPIVATKVGAIPEILPGEFLVEPADAEALAKKISRMLEYQILPKFKQEFSLQKMVGETENAILTISGYPISR